MKDPDLLRFREQLRVKRSGADTLLFDPIRRRWLALQPEEMVRQLLVCWLVQERGYNPNRINLERGLLFNGLARRYDLLVYGPGMQPFLLAECKAPRVAIGPAALRQIATYNLVLRVPYLLLTNGTEMLVYAIDHEQRTFAALPDLPPYPDGPQEQK